MKVLAAAILFSIVPGFSPASAASDNPGLSLSLPEFEARLSFGFNYDLLKSPLDVSFDQPAGFFGFNVPIGQTFNLRGLTKYMDPAMNTMFDDTALVKNGGDFKPRAGARQNPNVTVRVDVPMLGGVASFSDVQNFYLNYQTMLGNPDIFMSRDTQGVKFLLRGTLNVPLSLSMRWETMTFAYAYSFDKLLTMSLSLNRHVFSFDLQGKVDADLLGRYQIDLGNNGVDVKPIEGTISYPSDKMHGLITGYYDAEVWSPTLALQFWRFSFVSRFGIHTRAHGQLTASYTLPFFIDPETFRPSIDFNDQNVFSDPDVRIKLQTNAADSLSYSTAKTVNGQQRQSDLEWRMPTGLTAKVEVIRDHLSISYSKLFGEVGMKLDRIAKVNNRIEGDSVLPPKNDSTVIDAGLTVDHVITANIALWNGYANLGVFGMDFRNADRTHILGNAMMKQLRLGTMAMLPVLNGGMVFGTRWQLLVELDVLPLPALRSGVFYFF